MRNGSFGKGFTQGFIQSFALAAIQGEPQYSEESSFQERLNNFFHFRGWREDTFEEDFLEKDYTNFLTRLSMDMGYDLSNLIGHKVYYNPSIDGGKTRLFEGSGRSWMQIGTRHNSYWLASIPNATNLLVHEWNHVEEFRLKGAWGPQNPMYRAELAAIKAQYSHSSWLSTTPEFRDANLRTINHYLYPLTHPLAPGSPMHNYYIYGYGR